MNNDSLPRRHTLNKRIELFRHADGSLGLLCECCDRVNVEGKSWCCHWAKYMFFGYFFGRIVNVKRRPAA